MKNNKGQVAIFIIIAIVVFVSLIIFFLSKEVKVILPTGTEFSPEQYMSSCVRQAVRDTSDIMIDQGGFVSPTDYRFYNKTKMTFLCRNINYYAPCINQYPRYITSLANEIKNNIEPSVDSCLEALKAELEKRNYQVDLGSHGLQVSLKPSVVEVSIPINATFTKNGVPQIVHSLDTVVRAPVYDLGSVAQEIVSQEAQYCYFEYVGYMLLYPSFDVRVRTLSDATKIYTVTHLPTNKRMHFAIRGCVFPAGV